MENRCTAGGRRRLSFLVALFLSIYIYISAHFHPYYIEGMAEDRWEDGDIGEDRGWDERL